MKKKPPKKGGGSKYPCSSKNSVPKRSKKPSGRNTPRGRSTVLALGNVYSIDWMDHFGTERVLEDDDMLSAPIMLRTTGTFIRETPELVLIATEVHLDDRPPRRVRATGILKSAITRICDHGAA